MNKVGFKSVAAAISVSLVFLCFYWYCRLVPTMLLSDAWEVGATIMAVIGLSLLLISSVLTWNNIWLVIYKDC